jgi:lysophospholipid acyltransferase (LPLAT)-like uncharacterized protein
MGSELTAKEKEKRAMEQEKPPTLKQKITAYTIVVAVKMLCASLRLQVIGGEKLTTLQEAHQGAIIITWHGRTMIPIYRYRNRGYWALISLSLDGDIQAENFRLFGFQVIRGSTGRRSVMATRKILKALEEGGVLTFTPDGPRGPSQVAQEGVVYFAKKSGRPIIPLGIAANPAFYVKSWDKYLIPKPFAKACYVYGDPIFVNPDEENSAACKTVEQAINAAQATAEAQVCR